MTSASTTMEAASWRERRVLVRRFRKQMKLRGETLAKMAGISRPYLTQFEKGARRLSDKAWARVLAAIQKLLAEDESRRKQEREKAVQTAAKLGAGFYLGGEMPRFLAELFAFSPADLEKERVRLQGKEKLLSALSTEEYALHLKKLSRDELVKLFAKVLSEYNTLAAKHALLEQDRNGMKELYLAECDQSAARRKRVAELEQELKAYKELLPQSTRRIEELEQELTRERANKASGVVTITPDVPERKTSG